MSNKINKIDFENVFFTSDTFFGRKAVLEHRKQFLDINEMNTFIIQQWNKTVNEDSLIYHLGNFAWEPFVANDIFPKLNGNISFVIGNYDKALLELLELYKDLDVNEDQIIEIPELDIVISHYPLESWNNKDQGTIHIHGHTYNSLKTNLTIMNRFNVCGDFWSFKPVSLGLIKDLSDSYTKKLIDNE